MENLDYNRTLPDLTRHEIQKLDLSETTMSSYFHLYRLDKFLVNGVLN